MIIQPNELSAYLEKTGPGSQSGVQTPVKKPGAQAASSAKTRTASPARGPNAKPGAPGPNMQQSGNPNQQTKNQILSPVQKENEISTNPEVIRRVSKQTKPGEKPQPPGPGAPGTKPNQPGSKPNTPGPKLAPSQYFF